MTANSIRVSSTSLQLGKINDTLSAFSKNVASRSREQELYWLVNGRLRGKRSCFLLHVLLCAELHREDVTRLFSQVYIERTRGNVSVLQHKKLLLEHSERFFFFFPTVVVVKHWKSLPRETMNDLHAQGTFKTQMDEVPSDLNQLQS